MKELTDEQLERLIRECLEEKESLNEMAMSLSDYTDKVANQVFNVLTNLSCICIFHDIYEHPIKHWTERATEPFISLFSQDIKNETKQKREKAVTRAFARTFNHDYSAINEKCFKNLIVYYKNKTDKKERMVAPEEPIYYLNKYKPMLVQMLKRMIICLSEKDYGKWVDYVQEFVEALQNN